MLKSTSGSGSATTIAPGAPIGNVTPGTGAFTTLTSSAAAVLNKVRVWKSSSTDANDSNIGIGEQALNALTTGAFNTVAGFEAAPAATVLTRSVAIGAQSAKHITNGTDNVFVGYWAGTASPTNITWPDASTCVGAVSTVTPLATNQTAIGAAAACTADNQVTLGDSLVLEWVPGASGTVSLGSTTRAFKQVYVDYINTAVIGAVTMNKASGRVNIAASGTSVVVTNSLVGVNSRVFAQVATNDATARVTAVVSAAGSFTIFTPACTAQTAFNFYVVN